MNIDNYKPYFAYTIAMQGKRYFYDGKVFNISVNNNGDSIAKVKASKVYTVNFRITPKGDITKLSCNCSYEGYCKHEYAVLLAVEDKYEELYSQKSSKMTTILINEYCRVSARLAEMDIPDEQKVHIVPDVSVDIGINEISYILKIGRDKMYVIPDIESLQMDFLYGQNKKYGKNFEFTHCYEAIDEQSRKLLEFTYRLFRTEDGYRYGSRKIHKLRDTWLDNFMEMYNGKSLKIGKRECPVKFENPDVKINFKSINNRFSMSIDGKYCYLGGKTRACFYDVENYAFYVSDTDFSKKVATIFKILKTETVIYISKSDILAFYTAVLKPLSQYVQINGLELLDDITPPELVTQLYLDTLDDGEICAALEFCYGDEIYPAYYPQKKNPVCDYGGEAGAYAIVEHYFNINYDDAVHPYYISAENEIFDFITNGLRELSRSMEIYASERFERIKLRSPARPAVGIRPSGNLLEIDITADGYTPEELIALLGAYRRGHKYHRLRDGSFAPIDNSMAELIELAEGLDLSDKDFLKEHISVPRYRMLYLDSLQSDPEGMRIKRSRDFKNAVKEYTSQSESGVDEIPDGLDKIMREYQRYGFSWLKTLSNYGFGGILADDMGLGKTLQAISLMLSEKEKSTEHSQFLVVCPSSLTLNWVSETEKFVPNLKAVALAGTVSERARIFEKIDSYDLIVTSYATLARDIDKYENRHFRLHFIDEAQYIKNHTTQSAKAVKAVKSDIRFALTGTPVENSLAELWSIFDFVMPGYLFSYNHFKKTFESPITQEADSKAVAGLQKIVSPFILRRLKKEVLTELPDKTESVLYAEMGEEQSKLYSANVAMIKAELSEEFADQTDRIRILAMLTRLRQICCDPSLVYENYNGTSAKLEQCMELIESCVQSGHKILLFSQFTSMIEIIEGRLKKSGISFCTLTGKTKPKERIRLVNNFNENDVNVFLISLKAGGTGLNLTGADIVIHYDPWWNISAENQASDRAYRIGQKNNVQIYKLIAKNTLEEKIRILQQSKSELLDIAVGGEGDIMKMSANEVLEILK